MNAQGVRWENLGRIAMDVTKLVGRVIGDKRVPLRVKMLIFLAGVYTVAPVDLVPDSIPGAGRLDDILVLLLALDLVLNHVPADVIREHWNGDDSELEDIKRLVGKGVQFVPQSIRSKVVKFS